MSRRKKNSNHIIAFILVFLVAVAIFSGFMIIDSFQNQHTDESNSVASSKTITRNGKKYFPRQDITVFMLMGIDQFGPVQASNSYNNKGEADVIMLAVFDESDKTYDVVLLNRDTMADIPVIGLGGKKAGSIFAQLALAHTYGSGLEDSCENTVEAVSNLMNGLNIDYYMSMNMDAISILNDAVGGVKVNVTDDFSSTDPTIPMGEVVLSGEQAVVYLQSRYNVGDQKNTSRMERHKEYMENFFNALKEKSNDIFIADTYEAVSDYIVTDCSLNTVSNLFNRYSDYTFNGTISPEGESKTGDTYMEFYLDEDELDKLILDLFYSEK